GSASSSAQEGRDDWESGDGHAAAPGIPVWLALTMESSAGYTFSSKQAGLRPALFSYSGCARPIELRATNGNDQPAGAQAAQPGNLQEQLPGAGELPAAPRRLHARLHHHPEEAELGPPE